MSLRAVLILIAALAMAALTARLGLWQLSRAAQKEQTQQALLSQRALPPLTLQSLALHADQVAAQQHRLVRLQGEWIAERTAYLDNRTMSGRTGFYAVTPLRLDDGSVVLVQRGWLPRDMLDRTRIVAPPPAAGPVWVTGRVAPALGRLYEFESTASGTIRQNLDIVGYARETALPLRPFALVQEDGDAPPSDGLLRKWPLPAADVQKNFGYAFQWFALCALTFALYVWFQIIQPRKRRQP